MNATPMRSHQILEGKEMAPGIAIAERWSGRKGETAELIRRRNEELEREVREGREREEGLRKELERAVARLRVAEEAEERLCLELGELEAEAVAQAQEYNLIIGDLSYQLAMAKKLLDSSR